LIEVQQHRGIMVVDPPAKLRRGLREQRPVLITRELVPTRAIVELGGPKRELAIRREACRLRRRTGSILWRIEPRLAPPLPPYVRGFVRAPVDLDPFETNEVDLSGGMAGVLARMTSKGRYNVGLARRHGVEVGEVRERYGAEGYGPSLYICDPDGNTVELKGPATRGL